MVLFNHWNTLQIQTALLKLSTWATKKKNKVVRIFIDGAI